MSYIMVVTFTLVLLSSTLLGSASGASSPDCCRFKEVGGVKYALAGIQDTSAYNCLSPCVYMMADDINRSEKYCFAAGDLEVVCGEMANNTDNSGLGGCKCGKKKDERIVGGAEADINEWPWMVSMLFSDGARHKCGGTVVASEWIVTAAHCLYEDQELIVETKVEDVSIVLGEHDNFLEGEEILPRKVVKISKYIKHPDYDKLTSNADIALLKLAEKVDLNTYTPACMANTGDDFTGKTAWVYGWGALSPDTGDYPDKLQELSVKIVSQEVCQGLWVPGGPDGKIKGSEFACKHFGPHHAVQEYSMVNMNRLVCVNYDNSNSSISECLDVALQLNERVYEGHQCNGGKRVREPWVSQGYP